jgi:putative PEP-CTERM system TPR-repeat lipoprotein
MTAITPARSMLALLAAACLTLGFQGCSRETPEKFIASGKSYIAKRDFAAAIIQLKNAVQKAPDNAEARYLLGVALEESDEPVAAEIEYRKAIPAGYAAEVAYPALVRVMIEQGQFEKAITEASREQGRSPAAAELSALSGTAQLGLGKIPQAQAAFSAALAREPANETAMLGRARIAAIERDLPRAEQVVDEVLAKNPSSRQALLLKGDLLVAAQRNKEAVEAYAKAIDLRPRAIRPYLSLVPLLVRQKDLPAAKARMETLKKFARRSPAVQYLDALVAHSEGDRARAREAIQATLNATPEYVPALLLGGVIAYDSANYAQAEEYLLKVVRATPNAVFPRRLLVLTYLRSGQVERARDALEPLLPLTPNDVSTLNLAGEVALANKDIDKAAEYYKKALAIDPKNAQVQTRLGQAHLAAGDTQQGILDLESASSADSGQYQADLALLVLHLSRNELDKAQTAADALEKKQPNNPLTYNLVGLVALAKKDQALARSNFERALQLQPAYLPAARNLAILDMHDGKPEAARQRYEAMLAKDPKNDQLLLALVDMLQQTQAPAADIDKIIERAIAANPTAARPRVLKVNTLIQRRDAKSALVAAQQAQAALPQDVQVLDALGRAQLAAAEYEQAIATFGKLAALQPKYAPALLAQGQAYAAAKDWSGARQVIQKAIDLQPNLIEARMGLVRVGIQSGGFGEARAAARSIQKLAPTQTIGVLAEVDVLTAQNNLGEAERVLRSALEKMKNPGLVVRLVALLDSQGRKQDAEAVANAWAAQNPKDIVIYTVAAQLNLQRKDYAEAVRWYKSALKAQPNNALTLNNLAWALGQLHDPSALEYGDKALSLAPNSAPILDTVGWLNIERGNVARGVELLEKANKLAPNVPAVQLNLAKALIKAGKSGPARQQLEVLAKLPPGSPMREEAEKLLSSL